MKFVTIIGARPQIIKAAAISRAVTGEYAGRVREVIVHTGQHYDENMSDIFFRELGIPTPDYNLGTGSGSHGAQTADMLAGLEKVFFKEKPDAVLVYGDTDSTLAGAIAAAKMHIPVVHVEAGLRSFNKSMPEEVNRVLCDHVSTLLFAPTGAAIENLRREGFNTELKGPFNADRPGVFHCGDIMYDNALYFSGEKFVRDLTAVSTALKPGRFVLATIHRDSNTDDPARLTAILKGLTSIGQKNDLTIYLPLHPRTLKKLQESSHDLSGLITGPPASYLEMISLLKQARLIITDSGGVQKEAYYFRKPAVVLREQTEWTELVENGNNLLAGASTTEIINATETLLQKKDFTFPPVFGDGKAAGFIVGTMIQQLGK